jgi:hypothetical protein
MTANPAARLPVRDDWVNHARGAPLGVISAIRIEFFVKNFLICAQNKVQVFSCRISERFLLSARWPGARIAGVNKM